MIEKILINDTWNKVIGGLNYVRNNLCNLTDLYDYLHSSISNNQIRKISNIYDIWKYFHLL